MSIRYRLFDLSTEDPTRLFSLYQKTFPKARPLEKRWAWEYISNPNRQRIKVLVAEEKHRLVGSTTRLPVDILCGGEILSGAFNIISMVHPDYRRKRVMNNLYEISAEMFPLLLSRGSTPGMYNLLMKMGYRPILPNTFMTCILSRNRWLLRRLRIRRFPKRISSDIPINPYEDYQSVKRFAREFDEFQQRVAPLYPGLVIKDSAYMNWRYIAIPHKSYQVFYRMSRSKIITMVVLARTGTAGTIVDIMWDPEEKSEPNYTIRFAKEYFKRRGCLTLHCWGTLERLNDALEENSFRNGEISLPFSFYTQSDQSDRLADGKKIHFVHGDGDCEY